MEQNIFNLFLLICYYIFFMHCCQYFTDLIDKLFNDVYNVNQDFILGLQ